MKRRVEWTMAISAVVGTSVAAQVATPAAGAMNSIAPGTEVELMVLTEVNTRISLPGSLVRLRLNKPVLVDDKVVLPIGTPAFGKVDSVVKSGIAGSRGSIAIRMSHIEGSGGPIPLANELLTYQARGGKGDDAAKLLLAPMYAPFAPANSAKIKAGELVHARIVAAAR